MISDDALLRRVRCLTLLVIAGLLVSGLTALPLRSEVAWLANLLGSDGGRSSDSVVARWLTTVHSGLEETSSRWPFFFYGTDWLAFGHFAIALAFVGAYRDPIRNRWLFTFGLLTSALVVPWALTFGMARGIPLWWRLIDCCFGLGCLLPLWFCDRWSRQLECRG
jgi:hypothetical protein